MSSWRASLNRALNTPGLAALILALPLLAVVLATGLGFAPQTDEVKFHQDVVRQFAESWPAAPWRDYNAATTPLPYILWATWGKVVGFDLAALRTLTLLLSYGSVLAFYWTARSLGHAWPLAESLLLLFMPYVFLNSFTIYTVNVGLVFEVLALWCYLQADGVSEWKWLLWGGLAATVAIYCRQHYLFLPAGMGLWWLVARWRGRSVNWRDLRDLVLIGLPVMSFLPLCLVWGGMTPPAFQGLHPLAFRLVHVNFLVMFIGLYCAPAAIAGWVVLARWGWQALWLIVPTPLYWLFRPYYEQGARALSSSEQGIILHGMDLARGLVGPVVPALGGFALWANGVVAMAAGVSSGVLPAAEDSGRGKLWAWVVAFAGMLAVTDFVGERFYVLLMPVLLFLFYPRLAGPRERGGWRRAAVGLWLVGMALVGVVYGAVKMSGG